MRDVEIAPAPIVSDTDEADVSAIWVLSADARIMDAEQREQLAAALRPAAATGLLLETCHRVELYGTGAPPPTVGSHLAAGARLIQGRAAVRHLLRVAAGLESAVVGEDQVLSQLRRASDGLSSSDVRPELRRLTQYALGAGRRVRRSGRPRARGLATRALAWLEARMDGWTGSRLLVAGAGDMGTAVALGAMRRGADVVVATRTPRRLPTGLPSIGLDEGAALAPSVRGIVVALGGTWDELIDVPGALPPIVDLSSPRAVPPVVVARAEAIDIDELFEHRALPVPGDTAFIDRAEAEVAAAASAFERWVAARPSAGVARQLGERGRRRAERRATMAMRRLPELTERERAIVHQLAVQVAADILHEPLSHLGVDATGTARDAARDLFEL